MTLGTCAEVTMRIAQMLCTSMVVFNSVCFADKAAPITKQSIVLLSNNGLEAKDSSEKPPMKSSLQPLFAGFPSSKYQHMTPRSGGELLGGVLALEAREDMFMSLTSEMAFFSVSEYHFASADEAQRAFKAYVRESDPVRGHAIPWEIVVPKGDRIFYMRTDREFRQRTQLLDAFLKAVDAPNAPHFTCVDTYGCKMR